MARRKYFSERGGVGSPSRERLPLDPTRPGAAARMDDPYLSPPESRPVRGR